MSDMLMAAKAERSNMNTATNADARWFFPGRRAGQPLYHRSLADLVRGLGVPGRAARTVARVGRAQVSLHGSALVYSPHPGNDLSGDHNHRRLLVRVHPGRPSQTLSSR
ncbi:hypothetical protein [Streptosporangium sp. NPDC049644]|uniref:hypothetical protein n=1 Tax=Streptosporangium sp. NPDC049644 TaxID=3155507 RepID=UPI0034468798